MSTKTEMVRVDGCITHRTPSAFLMSVDGKDIWFARSLCSLEVDDEDGSEYLMVPEWMAIRHGLV